jgi:hypothetical protein
MDSRKASSRKEQRIQQLLTAKEQILQELSLYEGSTTSSKAENVSKKRRCQKPPSRQLPKLQGGRTVTSPYSSVVSDFSQSLDQIVAFPSSFANNSTNLKKKGMVKLPIFRLPAPDANLLALTQQLNNLDTGSMSMTAPAGQSNDLKGSRSPKKASFYSSSSSQFHKFVPIHDRKLVTKTFLLLLQQLSNEEKGMITNLLFLPPNELDAITYKLKESSNGSMYSPDDLLSNILTPHETVTIFVTTKLYLQSLSLSGNTVTNSTTSLGNWITRNNTFDLSSDSHDFFEINSFASKSRDLFGGPSVTSGSPKHYHHHHQHHKPLKTEALRIASNEFDFNSIGVSDNFKHFLLLENTPNVPSTALGGGIGYGLDGTSIASSSLASRSDIFTRAGGGGRDTGYGNKRHTADLASASNAGGESNHNMSNLMMHPPMMRGFSLPSIDKQGNKSHNSDIPIKNVPSFMLNENVMSLSSATSSFAFPPPSAFGSTRLLTSQTANKKSGTRDGNKTRGGTGIGENRLLPPSSSSPAHRATPYGGSTYGSKAPVNSSSLHSSSTPNLKNTISLDPLATPTSSDPNLLSSELLKSLLTVQKHTSLVKKSLESAQNFVTMGEYQNNTSTYSLSTNNKAKEAILILGSQKLAKALYKLCLIDMKRGYFTWKLYMIQYYRSCHMKALIKVINIRNILLGLNRFVIRLLKKWFSMWMKQTKELVVVLRRKKLLNAIIKIQSFFRQMIAKEKVRIKQHRKKYEKLYESTVIIQSLLRGKRIQWKYVKAQREKKEKASSIKIQCAIRGYLARKRVYLMKLRKNKQLAAILLQKTIRGKLTRNLYKRLLLERKRRIAIIKIQSLIRGFITRKNISTLLINRARFVYVVEIQKIARGYITRKNLHKKIRELEEYRKNRILAIIKIQSTYRMYHSKIIYRILLFQRKFELNKHTIATTKIQKIGRGYNARQLKKLLLQERLEQWITQARQWLEVWSDDTQSYFYYNNTTGESIWEPSAEGYTKHDGKLVLQSGEIIDDPDAILNGEEGDNGGFGDDGTISGAKQQLELMKQEKKKKTKKQLAKLCNECSERYAIRLCNECGDQFCTKCYKTTHMLGARRHHTYKMLGPKDCNECENVLAIRFCVSCDECFCDVCWRRLHSHGKRIFHPYSEINPEGRIDKRIFIMDGDQVSLFLPFSLCDPLLTIISFPLFLSVLSLFAVE